MPVADSGSLPGGLLGILLLVLIILAIIYFLRRA